MDNGQLDEDYLKQTGVSPLDSLTGLFNHGFFHLSLERELRNAGQSGTMLTLALMDMDLFSAFNKAHGPIEGDRMLKKIADLVLEDIRESDLAARYSGDVIAVILPDTDRKTAHTILESLRKTVAGISGTGTTVSIGLASFPDDATTTENLLEKAGEALHQAKIRGKNRVYFNKEKEEPTTDSASTILVVDDDPRNVKLLEALLSSMDYSVLKAFSGEDALSIVKKTNVDLVLLDIMMPGMDGYEVCRRLKGKESTRMIPVVLITALDDLDSKIKGIEAGADDFITKPPNKTEILTRAKTLTKVKALNNNLTSIENVLFSMANAVEAKDSYTQGHIQRVAHTAVTLASIMGLPKKEVEAARLGGILHDIGKIGISRKILNKPGPLDPEEWDIMREHPKISYNICLPLEKNLGLALDPIRHHHEKLDGSGYPDGLKKDEISTAARIMAIADIYDALVTDRPYRKGMSVEKAFRILLQEADEGKLDKNIIKHLQKIMINDG